MSDRIHEISETYSKRLEKWQKFDNLMHDAAGRGENYEKFQKIRDSLKPKLDEAKQEWDELSKMFYDHAKRELEKK